MNDRSFFVEVQGEVYQFWFVRTFTRHLWGQGTTCAHIQRYADGATALAVAYCSRKDEFSHRRGEQESLKRLMDMMPWRARDRKKVWGAWRLWREVKRCKGVEFGRLED